MAIRSLKKAEESDLYIIRLYEMQGKSAQNVEITFPDAIESAYETNGIEEKIGEVTIQTVSYTQLYVYKRQVLPLKI